MKKCLVKSVKVKSTSFSRFSQEKCRVFLAGKQKGRTFDKKVRPNSMKCYSSFLVLSKQLNRVEIDDCCRNGHE